MHRDDGTTVWHTILAFGDQAKQLQHRSEAGELSKGQKVSLIGYQHTRQVRLGTRDGGTKMVRDLRGCRHPVLGTVDTWLTRS